MTIEVHKCPVCDGTGLVSRPPWVAGDAEFWYTSDAGPWSCKSCFGRGIIYVNIDELRGEYNG